MALMFLRNGKWYDDGKEIKTYVDQGVTYREDTGEPVPVDALPFKSFADFANEDPKTWLIKGVIALEEDSSWWGPSGGLKSTLMAEIALHVAAARDWRDHEFNRDVLVGDDDTPVRRGAIIFATERAKLTRRRLTAYIMRENLPLDLPVAVVDAAVNLMDPSCVAQISDTILAFEQEHKCSTGLVIFDTWSKCLGGQKEDLAEVQNCAATHVKKIRERHYSSFHCASVGHTGKNIEAGERGSNARRAHVDLAVKIYGAGSVKTAKVEKANDGPEGVTLATFEAQEFTVQRPPVMLGERVVTPDPFMVGILAPYDPATLTSEARAGDPQVLTIRYAQALDALKRAIAARGQNGAVHVDYWKAELSEAGLLNLKAKNPRSAFKKLRDGLTQHLIDEPNGLVRIKSENPIPGQIPPCPPYAPLVPTSPS
ncbi:AAA family ATPase [Bradyrhizobium sp. Pear77]|uniref:AAA family ATPase n=1 Tax=Bradyrhizobium altum TaxID=1571202 RepID=UPI001E584DB4|nr:AAA family ATPase [Bradyrhizobium altum]MCC8954099.1 AAA family ATPase [Bradyrhizobium altum]